MTAAVFRKQQPVTLGRRSLTVRIPTSPSQPASQGKGGGFHILKVDSFMLVWLKDEFTSNLGKVQVFPRETERLCSFSCRRFLQERNRGEEPDGLISPRSSFALGFLPHHGTRGREAAQGCPGMLGGERSRPGGQGWHGELRALSWPG